MKPELSACIKPITSRPETAKLFPLRAKLKVPSLVRMLSVVGETVVGPVKFIPPGTTETSPLVPAGKLNGRFISKVALPTGPSSNVALNGSPTREFGITNKDVSIRDELTNPE